MDEETFLREMQASFKHKFASKPEVIDGNMKALEMASEGGTIMATDISKLGVKTKWQDLTEGMIVAGAGTSKGFPRPVSGHSVKPEFIEDKCKQCLLCVPVCPDSCIPVKDMKRGAFDYDHCKGCGICVKACPFGAITMEGVK